MRANSKAHHTSTFASRTRHSRALATATVAVALASTVSPTRACDLHWVTGLPEGITLTTPTDSFVSASDAATAALAQIKALDNANAIAAFSTTTNPSNVLLAVPPPTPLNAIASWKINWNNAKGHSPNATINSFISNTATDVTGVWFDANYVYIKTNDVPSYDVGRADGNNPAYARATNQTLRITRNPTPNTGTLTSPGNGQIAVASNGVAIFDPGDAQTYNNAGTWHRQALVFEGATFDTGPGHSAPQGTPSNSTPGTYHYHVGPTALLEQIDITNNGTRHSPIIGFAPDGYPIYGPYGSSDPTDPNGPIKIIGSSYRLRTDLTPGAPRNTLTPGGTLLTGTAVGPAVSAAFPAGAFKEDYAYVPQSGDLNNFNMRFAATPEFPNGTWAYYMTINAQGNFVYPHILGPQFYGVVAPGALQNVTIPAAALRLLAGDTNFDGLVNFTDLTTFAGNYRRRGVTLWSQGDFDSNIDINDADLALLQQNYTPNPGSTFAADWVTAQASIPEPSTLGTLAVVAAGVMSRRRR